MVKREQRFTTKLVKWLKDNAHFSGPVEVKLAQPRKKGGDRLCKSQFAPHQIPALRAASNSEAAFVWKIPDAGWANPFDLIVFKDSPSFVCAVFGEKRFYLVPASKADALFRGSPCVGELEVSCVSEVSGSL